MQSQPLAYLDHEFLESEEARPLRILAEYLEPLRRFKAQNIQDTVVFFGSARIHSREQRGARARAVDRSGDRRIVGDLDPRARCACARRLSGRGTTKKRASWRRC